MPKVMTDAYRNASFILPFTDDKSEYAVIKPLTDSQLAQLRIDAAKEAGADTDLEGGIFVRLLLRESVQNWQGFYDVAGKELPFSQEVLKDICESDPDFAAALALRVRNVARLGELEERKN